MNNDYLWDRTGEPDAEIQRLEEILGTLRYESRQLAIPAQLRPERRRMFFPPLAIAAAIAMMVVAAGLWFALSRQKVAQPSEAKTVPAGQKLNDKQTPGAIPNGSPIEQLTRNPNSHTAIVTAPRHRPSRNVLASNPRKRRGVTASASGMTAEERDQAEAAKDKLMLALRVATTKLSLAQRKAQGTPAANTIRNQHRIG
jgi:hypothetical protein